MARRPPISWIFNFGSVVDVFRIEQACIRDLIVSLGDHDNGV